jgi:hypothetical protein
VHEVFRVLKPFRWRGWHYGREHVSLSIDPATQGFERCDCGDYAGDILVIEAGHPRKEHMLAQRFVVGDPSLPSAEELLKEPRFSRLLSPPTEKAASRR